MSSNENTNDSSNFSLHPTDWEELHEWQDRLTIHNQEIDSMIDEVAFRLPSMILQHNNQQSSRARRRYIERQREKGHDGVFEQYFSDNPIYPPEVFRTRFRMSKSLFERIMSKLVLTDPFFQQKSDATGRPGMSSIQKCTATLRALAYGAGADLHDEYLRMSAQTIKKSVKKFAEGVISNFRDEYLRRPNEGDIAYLLHIGEQRGFPGMLGSIDCMHWEWKNCPSAWAGHFTGRNGKATIILEAYNQKSSGMSEADIEQIAQQLYTTNKFPKFTHHEVFEKVMRHHPKWELNLGVARHRTRIDLAYTNNDDVEEDRGNSKKSRTTEGDDDQGNSSASTIRRPTGRDKAKGKRKAKATTSQPSIFPDDYVATLNAMTINREKERITREKEIVTR